MSVHDNIETHLILSNVKLTELPKLMTEITLRYID